MSARKRSAVLSLALLACALSAFPQAYVASLDRANQLGENAMRSMPEKRLLAAPSFNVSANLKAGKRQMFDLDAQQSRAMLGNEFGKNSKSQPLVERVQTAKPPDFNRDIYYRNKLEFSLDTGWLPINVPFPLDVFVGDAYNTYPLNTLSSPSLLLSDGIWTV